MVEKKNLHKNPRSNDSIIILEFHLFRLLINKIVLIISAVKIFIFPLPIGNVRGRKCAQNAADDDIAKFVAETSGSYPPPPPPLARCLAGPISTRILFSVTDSKLDRSSDQRRLGWCNPSLSRNGS